jgi:O-antigen/teichoic acid export membrane protein
LNAYGEINPLCPNCATWDIKTSVEAGAYVGLFPLILAGFAILRLFRRKKTAQEQDYAQSTVIFAVLAGLALLFAFGTPLYALLYYGLPGWNQLHSPFRWIYPFTLSLAVLTGLGFAQLERSRCSFSVAHLLGWGGLLGTVATLIVFAVPEPFVPLGQFVIDRSGLAQNAFADGRQFLSYQWPHALHLFAVLGLSGLALRLLTPRRASEPRRSLVFGLTVLIVGVDLLIAGWSFNPATDPALLDFTPPAVEWLQAQQEDDPFFRLTSFDSPSGRGNKILNANTAMGAQLFDVRGYDSIILGQYHQFMQLIQPNNDGLFNRVGPVYAPGYAALDSALLDLLGVRYVLTTEDIPNAGYSLVYDEEIKIYENLDVLPRAFLVADTEIAPADLNFALRSLNPRETVILDGEQLKPGLDLSQDAAHSPLESAGVVIVSYERNTVELEAHVTAEAGRWLVLADTYFNGWRAYVHPLGDETAAEQEVTIHRANENFRAVYLPEGSWAVRFYYAPMSFRIGLYVSFLAGVLLIFLLALWSWGRLYRESETDSPIKRIAKNSLVPMVMALSNRLIDFAFALLMLRILQPEGAGRYAFAVAFISMAEIITRYGLGTLVTRDVAGDRSRSNRYLSNVSILRLYLWLAALPFMGAILAMYVIFGSTTNDVVITVAIFAFGTLFSNLSDGLTAIFYAHEKAEYPAAIASVTTLTRVSLGALVLLLGWGIIGLAVASVAANLVAFAALSLILLQKIFRPTLETDSGLQREMMAESLPLMLNHMLSTIFFRIDVFILKPTWGDAQVGYYNAAYKYIDGINVIPQYFTLAIFPLMSKFATDSQESLVRAYLLSLRLLLILALPIAVGTPFVAHELILFLAGESYLPDSTIVLQLLIWFLPFSFINQVTQYVLIAINQQRALTKAFIIGVGFNILANLIFIPLYGYRAAAVTTILSEWALLIPFYRLVRTHLCTVPWLDVIWRPAVAAAAMGGALWLVGDINFGLTVLLGGVVYGVTLPLLGGLNQQDMAVIWRAIPWKRLRAYLPGR